MGVKITYFVHGTTTDNLEHKSTGWLPGELSQKGIDQSILLKEQVDINQFDVVFCSDLQRAIDSAKYTFEGIKEIIQDERLRECNYGDYNGQDSSLAKYEEHITEKFPNGECMLDVEKRIKDVKVNGDRVSRLPGNSNMSFKGVDGETLLLKLDSVRNLYFCWLCM